MQQGITVNIRNIPPDLWRKVKMLAIDEDVTVPEIVTKALYMVVNGKRVKK
jgi:hypothetical protein